MVVIGGKYELGNIKFEGLEINVNSDISFLDSNVQFIECTFKQSGAAKEKPLFQLHVQSLISIKM